MTGHFPRRAHQRRWAGALAGRGRRILSLSARAAWRGFTSLYNSDDLTHSASIAYYALLSLFPFLLLVFSLLGSITEDDNDRIAVLTFVFRYFPTKLDFANNQLLALSETSVRPISWSRPSTSRPVS